MIEVDGIILVLSCQKHLDTRLKHFKLPKDNYGGWKVIYVIGDLFLDSDYKMNALVRRDELHKILVNQYRLFSTLETIIYQGINTKYYYNEESTRKNGICWCEKPCNGQGNGKSLGECKRITIAIF